MSWQLCPRYVPPVLTQSCKPKQTYGSSPSPVEDCTVYRLSYSDACRCGCRPAPLRAHDNLRPSACRFEADTTQNHDFRCWPCARRAQPVLPCNRNMIGEGPLSCLTTARHDYVPKVTSRVEPIKPPTQLRCSHKPLECTTIMTASFQAPCQLEPVTSFKPVVSYQAPCQPFQRETVQRLSYVPLPLKTKEHYPWACKGMYKCPATPMECTSVYSCSFSEPGMFVDDCCQRACPAPCSPACKASCFGDCKGCLNTC